MLRNPLAIPDLLLLPVTISHLARGKKIEEAKKNRISDEELEKLEAVFRFSVAQLLAKGKKK